jgi:glycolate oxidase FAD binding subunit
MTSIAAETRELLESMSVPPKAGMPDTEFVVAPLSIEQAAAVLAAASESGLVARPWGSGSHQGIGYPLDADIIVSTDKLHAVVDWQHEDLTVVVEPGVRVATLEEMLAERSQTAVLPESPGDATVGGVLAAGLSGWRRLRYGPTRDRVLEVVVATGDGRVVRGGAQVVKNVTGYDLPRLMVGSLGGLGLIGRVCLKLWPAAVAAATVMVPDPAAARQTAFRPLAVVETHDGAAVYLGGTTDEVDAQSAELGGEVRSGLHWPELPAEPWRLQLRVPPRHLSTGVTRVRQLDEVRFVAAHGVGEIAVAVAEVPTAWAEAVREWAEGVGGALVVMAQPRGGELDPWGTAPASLDLQRRVKAAFDPAGVVNPGRLPGRL